MNGSELCKALKNGMRVYGTSIVSTSPEWPVQVQRLGLDFIFIDLEHVAIDRASLSWMCHTYSAMNIAPVVRIPNPDPHQARMAIDAGAQGIVAPYIENAAQVELLRGAVKLRPIQGKRLQELLDDVPEAPGSELDTYIAERNQCALIANIESVPAMESLDKILAVPQLDAVLIGPHDLSCSLGIPEQYDHPKLGRAVRSILRKARENNIGAGIHYIMGDIEQEIRWIKEEKANLILHRADLIVFIQGMRREIQKIKTALGDTEIPSEDRIINI